MRAKLISRIEDHTFVIQMDHDLAHLLFTDPCMREKESQDMTIRPEITKALDNANFVFQARVMKTLLNELKPA